MKPLMFINKFLKNSETITIFLVFLGWRVWMLVFGLIGIISVPIASPHFFGGTLENYITNPLFWGFGNFDGEHYLAIAQRGYKLLEHSFFPLYPLLVKAITNTTDVKLLQTGALIVSNISFIASLLVFWQLVRIDFSKKVAAISLVSLLVFPTSFYFGATYTESLFLFLLLATFLLVRKSHWFWAVLAASLVSAVRVFGIFVLPALIVEWLAQRRERKIKTGTFLYLLVVPLGFLIYLIYLYQTTGSALSFYTDLQSFGQQRSSETLTLLPQVFWRYIKMLLTVQKESPLYLTIVQESASAVLVAGAIIYGFVKRVNLAYLVFLVPVFILPTLTGSFSSLPRYVLNFFPVFILLGVLLEKSSMKFKVTLVLISITLLIVNTALFVRGYWIG